MVRLRFDFRGHGGAPRSRVFEQPVALLHAMSLDEVVPALAEAEAAARSGRWVAGFLSYEAAPAFDEALHTHLPGRLPLLWLGVFDRARDTAPATSQPSPAPLTWTPATSRAAYDVAFARIREALLAGESYQVNYTTRLHAALPAGFSAGAAYDALHRAQGYGYHADLDLGDVRILSASPELFFTRVGRTITTRPMKGTHARGRWQEEDDAFAGDLVACEKERAENLMIVDLLRSDVGRIARTGTVRVQSLYDVERYPTVLQMTSTITAALREEISLPDIFRALFPCGSVTGAPKVSTMKLIRSLEPAPREVYCGAIGILEPGGDCTFSVPIRTMWIDAERNVAEYSVGSGITIDATPDREAAELREKSGILLALRPEFSLIETMRLETGRIVRLERHLARIAASCSYFGRPFPEARIRKRLAALCEDAAAAGIDRAPQGVSRRRVRLTLDAHGTISVDVARLDDAAFGTDALLTAVETNADREGLRFAGIAPRAVESHDVFLYHKTTLRSIYERTVADAPGHFDVVLGNERDEATEFTRGNLVALLDDGLVTPPRTAGLLAGCLRNELLDAGVIRERSIRLDELNCDTRLWFVNSLRGAVEVRCTGGTA